MICPKCNNTTDEISNTCKHCGTELRHTSDEVSEDKCQSCGYNGKMETTSWGDKVCPKCFETLKTNITFREITGNLSNGVESPAKDEGSLDRDIEKKNTDSTKYYLLAILGIFLHMVFGGYNLTGDHPLFQNFQSSLARGRGFEISSLVFDILEILAYSLPGIALSVVIFGPIAWLFFRKNKQRLMISLLIALYIGVMFRIYAWYLPESRSPSKKLDRKDINSKTEVRSDFPETPKNLYYIEEFNFVACFPTPPDTLSVINDDFQAVTFISWEPVDDGFIKYSVTVNRFINFDVYKYMPSEEVFSHVLIGFAGGFGKESILSDTSSFKFSDNYDAIRYKVRYLQEGNDLINRGLLIRNGKLLYRVSATYPIANAVEIQKKYENFISLFTLIH